MEDTRAKTRLNQDNISIDSSSTIAFANAKCFRVHKPHLLCLFERIPGNKPHIYNFLQFIVTSACTNGGRCVESDYINLNVIDDASSVCGCSDDSVDRVGAMLESMLSSGDGTTAPPLSAEGVVSNTRKKLLPQKRKRCVR